MIPGITASSQKVNSAVTGNAGDFSSASARQIYAYSPNLTNVAIGSDFEINALVKFSSIAGTQVILQLAKESDDSQIIGIGIHNGEWYAFVNGSPNSTLFGADTPDTTSWFTIELDSSITSVAVTVNGTAQNVARSSLGSGTENKYLEVGQDNGSNVFSGIIDYIKILETSSNTLTHHYENVYDGVDSLGSLDATINTGVTGVTV